jgi:hypothetical protein
MSRNDDVGRQMSAFLVIKTLLKPQAPVEICQGPPVARIKTVSDVARSCIFH